MTCFEGLEEFFRFMNESPPVYGEAKDSWGPRIADLMEKTIKRIEAAEWGISIQETRAVSAEKELGEMKERIKGHKNHIRHLEKMLVQLYRESRGDNGSQEEKSDSQDEVSKKTVKMTKNM